ncbi:MAG: Gfo/Idh/MocA family oxidoreductase, partial [Deltaproteobacteria bacterium]
MSVLDAVVVGAGNRGRFTYGGYARQHPSRLRIVALAEPHEARRAAMSEEHGIPADRRFASDEDLFAAPRLAPLAIVATGDTQHVEPALRALDLGYHVLLEKPIALCAEDCVRVVEAADRAGRILQIGHVLRFTPFYTQVREILATGALGELLHIDMREHIAHWHMAHSFVRGKFRSRAVAAPIVLAKSCHDLDLLAWFAGRPAERLSSFGSLRHFRSDAAPAGAPTRCTDGCPAAERCPHDAVRFYAGPDDDIARSWPWSDVSLDPARAARQRALESGPYGRCVYHCDNDVPDHQVVAIEFDGGMTASFALQGLATHERRTIRVAGSAGELRGVFEEGVIEVSRHGSFERERHAIPGSAFGHYGGDTGLLDHVTGSVAAGSTADTRASGRVA